MLARISYNQRAVNYGYHRGRKKAVLLMLATALLGASFFGRQAFDYLFLINP